jgi:hypothetical protein
MAELERDLERLLAGDQNVGSPPVRQGDPQAVERRAPRRWPLFVAASLALAGGVALAISRPGSSRVEVVGHARPALPSATPPPAPSEIPAAIGPAVPTALPHRAHVRPERHVARAIEPAAGGNLETSESVKRGVLPSGSREAYPQK